jgi:hypothetical protein
VKAQAARVRDTFTDGISVDIEDALKADQPQERKLLTVLMHELKGELDRQVPNHQLTFDVAWSPQCVDERCYDYKARADTRTTHDTRHTTRTRHTPRTAHNTNATHKTHITARTLLWSHRLCGCDLQGLADFTDFLFVMAYDMQSQIPASKCIAGANSGYPRAEEVFLFIIHYYIYFSSIFIL